MKYFQEPTALYILKQRQDHKEDILIYVLRSSNFSYCHIDMSYRSAV